MKRGIGYVARLWLTRARKPGPLGGEVMASMHAWSWAPEPGAGRVGHWAPEILVGVIVASIVLTVRPPSYETVWGPVAPVLLIGIVVAAWIQMRQHDRSLCERCIGSMPLNPSAAAQRYKRRLALVHLGSERRAIAVYFVFLFVANLGLALAPPALLQLATLAWAAAQSTLIYLVLSHTTHRRLQPWCQQCGDGGGPAEDVDVPDPQPFDSRSG